MYNYYVTYMYITQPWEINNTRGNNSTTITLKCHTVGYLQTHISITILPPHNIIKYADSYTVQHVHDKNEALQCKSLSKLNNWLNCLGTLELAADNKIVQHAVMIDVRSLAQANGQTKLRTYTAVALTYIPRLNVDESVHTLMLHFFCSQV